MYQKQKLYKSCNPSYLGKTQRTNNPKPIFGTRQKDIRPTKRNGWAKFCRCQTATWTSIRQIQRNKKSHRTMPPGGSVPKSQKNRSCSSIKLLFSRLLSLILRFKIIFLNFSEKTQRKIPFPWKSKPVYFDVSQKIHGFINNLKAAKPPCKHRRCALKTGTPSLLPKGGNFTSEQSERLHKRLKRLAAA